MVIEVRGRITESGTLEVTLPAGMPPGDVTVRIEPSSSDSAWTEEELREIQDAAPKTFQQLAQWLATAPPTEPWGSLRDDEDVGEYIHNMRHTSTMWPDTSEHETE